MIEKKQKVVAIIEDNDELRELLVDVLESEQYRVLTATNGKEGLGLLRRMGRRIDLLLLDANMPVMSARGMLDAIGRDPALSAEIPPIVIVSAHAHSSEFPEATMFIGKPFDLSNLLAVVDRYCNKVA